MTTKFSKKFIMQQTSSGGEKTVLITKNITENGTYNASDDNADGYSSVTVDVPGGGGGNPVIKSNVIRTCESEYHCKTGAQLNSHLTQNGGTLDAFGMYTSNNSGYLLFDEVFPLSNADSWEFGTKIILSNSSGGTIFGYYTTVDCTSPLLLVANGNHLMFFLSSNGGSWDIVAGGESSSTLSPGVPYYLKAGFSGTEYYIEINTTGWESSFNRIYTLSSTAKTNCTVPMCLMTRYYSSSGFFPLLGNIYLNETYFNINGTEYIRCASDGQIIF